MAELLEIKNLSKEYTGGVQALKGIDLKVAQGEFLVLLGLSGSGKSTLLRCINRLIEPTSGSIKINGEDVCKLSGKHLRGIRRQIGMVYQQFNLISNMSVILNVLSGRLGYLNLWQSIRMGTNRELLRQAEENLEKVGLSDYSSVKVKNLSGGQQQRVAIARALMQKPELILADEPVASLDPATADSVMHYLGELNQREGITIICSLHFLSLARKYGSRVTALKAGELVYSGSPQEIDNKRFKAIYGESAEEVEIR